MNTSIKLSSPATREFWEIPILFEDEHLLVLDKPAGLGMVSDPGDPDRPSLLGLIHEAIELGKPWATQRGLSYLMNAHRLDPEASGVLLFAKSKEVVASLRDLFGTERPLRTFVTLVTGVPGEAEFEVEAKLAPARLPREATKAPESPPRSGVSASGPASRSEGHPEPIRMRVDPRHGKRCRTRLKVIERFAGWTLLECHPTPLRTHQIRVHLSYLRLPLAGDRFYGGKPLMLSTLKSEYRLKAEKTERPLVGAPIVHASELTIPHPVSQQLLTIAAPWPRTLEVAVKYLRRYATALSEPG